jgi:hypothetical protein
LPAQDPVVEADPERSYDVLVHLPKLGVGTLTDP